MRMMQSGGMAAGRGMAALVSGLEIEFGRGAGEALAQRFLEAEEIDFHWDAREQERWIGTYESAGDEDFELDRVAIVGRLDRSEEHTSELQSLMRISYAVFCLKKKKQI